jgi:hypothetical protein
MKAIKVVQYDSDTLDKETIEKHCKNWRQEFIKKAKFSNKEATFNNAGEVHYKNRFRSKEFFPRTHGKNF